MPSAKSAPSATRFAVACAGAAVLASGCRDLSGFSTGTGSFSGVVVDATFVRSGISAGTRMCMTLDANHFHDGPGAVWTDDFRFTAAPFRPVPQLWSDPLSTLSFGEGRLKNFVYVLGATSPFTDGNGNDVLAVLSLMQSGGVEVRLLRGAPPLGAMPDAGGSTDGGDTTDGGALEGGPAIDVGNPGPIFAIFTLSKQNASCSF